MAMWGDYGYIEDERGQSYDLKHVWRFFKYGRPYTLLFTLAAFLILGTTAADLVLPYLTKMAVDDHIIVWSQAVVESDPTPADPAIREWLDRNRRLLRPSGREGLSFLSAKTAREIEPAILNRLKAAGVLKPQNYYLVARQPGPALALAQKYPDIFQTYPEVLAVAVNALGQLSPAELWDLRSFDVSGLGRLAILAVVVLFLGYLFHFGQVIILEYCGQSLTHDVRQDLMAHVLGLSMSFHDRSSTGQLVSRLTNDVQNLSEMINSVAVTFFQDTVILGGIVVILFYINWPLALATMVLLPPIILTTRHFRRKAREVFRELRARVAQINTSFGETIAGIRVIQAFRREVENRRRFDELNHQNYLAGIRQVQVFAVFMPLIELLAALALGLIIWYGGLGVLNETMTLGAVVAYISYVRKFFMPIRDLAEKFNILQSSLASLERIFRLKDTEVALPASPRSKPILKTIGTIEFDHVSFAYEPDVPVLKDVSFRVEVGQTLAVVGATGAGKTSLVNLLMRFYDPTQGRILIDGRDIRDLPLTAHRARLGLVMQDVFIFAGAIKENIAFSRDHIPLDQVQAAARAVGADEFITKLPQGYEQLLGEGGLSLSVGQRQLLSFARTLAQDPKILILDEATAFIDSETEMMIETAIEPLLTGRTSIIIAHRLSTIQRADRILVLHRGRVRETGTHAQLLAQRGLYYRLYELQLGGN